MGYHRAGFDVIGIDIDPQPNYPFPFIQGDALEAFEIVCRGENVNAVHASPPCQAYSNITFDTSKHVSLVEPTRRSLAAFGAPFVIENVMGAPLENPVMLCGRMFQGLRVYRHRLFETNWELTAPPHPKHDQLCFTHDKRKPHYGKLDDMIAFVQVTGGGNSSKAAAADAMGIDWMGTKHDLNEAIPPAYTEYIGRQLIKLGET